MKEKVDEKFRTKLVRIIAYEWTCENCGTVNTITAKERSDYCYLCFALNYFNED